MSKFKHQFSSKMLYRNQSIQSTVLFLYRSHRPNLSHRPHSAV